VFTEACFEGTCVLKEMIELCSSKNVFHIGTAEDDEKSFSH
jgi:hypothetical protein